MSNQYTVISSITDKPLRYCTCVESDKVLLLGENEYLVEGFQARVAEDKDPLEGIRVLRGLYLQESDWTQLEDNPLSPSKKAEWTTYRQSLRDIPSNYPSTTSLNDITWPTPPTGVL